MTNEQVLDNALSNLKKEQERDLIIDFDSATEKVKPIIVRYGKEMYRSQIWYWICLALSYVGIDKLLQGCFRAKEYKVPSETPQWYMNIVNRKLHELRSLDFSELSEKEIIERAEIDNDGNELIFRKLFGNEFVDKYLDDNYVSFSVLNNELLNPILVKWGWKPATDTTEKKSLTTD